MERLKLPALPASADPAAFIAECEAALTILVPMESSLQSDLDNEEYHRKERGRYRFPKAVAHMTEELKAVRARKKEIGVARCDAVTANAATFAESYDREADSLRPNVVAAREEAAAATKRLADAEAALGWAESRAGIARSRIDSARRDRELFDPTPFPYRPSAGPGQMELTTEQELALLGRR